MPRYRIYLRDTDEQIISHGTAECTCDHEACVVAANLIEPGEQAEVWDGLRRVHLIGLTTIAECYRSIN